LIREIEHPDAIYIEDKECQKVQQNHMERDAAPKATDGMSYRKTQ
jgi:hypothetical protein